MLCKSFLQTQKPWHETLREKKQPIFIYGMGDGCEKILSAFEKYNLKCEGIFASDDFVRNHQFAGYKVKTLSQIEDEYNDFSVAVAFGTSIPNVMKNIDEITAKHTLVFPDTSVIGHDCFSKSKILDRFDDVYNVYSLLADEKSKQVFENVLLYKITGEVRFLKEVYTTPSEAYNNILKLTDNETYCDLGAYTGDTIKEFLAHTDNKYRQIIALEPNKKNFKKCVKNSLYLENISFYNNPAWNTDTIINFSQGSGRQAQIDSKGAKVFARSLDNILSGKKCTYIKYDVEGADKQALLGSEKTIQKHSPKICTALYHRCYDLIDIPLLIHRLNPNYSFYIRQYQYYPAWETNLFCI